MATCSDSDGHSVRLGEKPTAAYKGEQELVELDRVPCGVTLKRRELVAVFAG